MSMCSVLGAGTSSQHGMEGFRRAVLQAPPSRFTIDFLDIPQDNGSPNHGMRIHPIISKKSSIISRSSSSTISHRAYDIWRRWEDCLKFQETLEVEYARAAQEKKLRLLQGKGVKSFNGIYKQDLASSWDSLPAGPDPNSIAQDIHQHLPTLTKRGTIFRPSQTTIERRQKELEALIKALFSDDMPTLIKEIRATDIVTDFFGVWRRDYDQAQKRHSSPQSSTSSNSVFESYFSTSNPTPPGSYSGRSSASLASFERPRTSSGISSRRLSDQSHSTITQQPRRRTSSTISSDSSSTVSESSYESRASRSPTTIVDHDSLVAFGHNPHTSNERLGLDVLPEEPETSNKLPDKSMEGLNLSLANALKENIYSQPMASISDVMLSDSSESKPPQSGTTLTHDTRFGFPSRPRILIPASSPSPEISSDIDDYSPSLISDRSRRPKTSVKKHTVPSISASPYNDVSASPTSSIATSRFSASTIGSSSGFIQLKVAHHDSIIMLRMPRDASLAELRDKLHDKFVNQEGVSLSNTFSIALAPSPGAKSDDSIKSQTLKDDMDWERLLCTTTGTKVNLHVHDSTA